MIAIIVRNRVSPLVTTNREDIIMKKISMIAMSAILLAGVAACSATQPADEADVTVVSESAPQEVIKGEY